MASSAAETRRDIRYEPDETPPRLLSLGLGMQYAMIAVPSIVLTPTILIQTAGGGDAYLVWAVCSALAISGITTAVQAVRVGRIGSGYVMLMGSSSAFLAVCVSALVQGGPGLLATLIIVSSLFPVRPGGEAVRAPADLHPDGGRHRRYADPGDPGPGHPRQALRCAGGRLSVGRTGDGRRHAPRHRRERAPRLRPVAPLGPGRRDGRRNRGRAGLRALRHGGDPGRRGWVGLPPIAYPGLDLGFGPAFWALLPAFVLVTLVGAMDTLGDGVAIQRVSWRRPRAIDFRSIQGAMSTDGLGNLLSGLAGTVPNTTYATGISIVELTGVAARSVGASIGLVFVAIAFLPKLVAAIIAIPGPVVAGYFVLLVAKLFTFGIEILQHDGLDYRKGLVVGLGFWIGLAFQLDWIFPEYFQGPWSEMLGNGMTVGGLTVIALTLFNEVTGPRRQRLRVGLSVDAYPKIDAFLSALGSRRRWSAEMTERVRAVGEETLLPAPPQGRGTGVAGRAKAPPGGRRRG